jgi:hypothetical protein
MEDLAELSAAVSLGPRHFHLHNACSGNSTRGMGAWTSVWNWKAFQWRSVRLGTGF